MSGSAGDPYRAAGQPFPNLPAYDQGIPVLGERAIFAMKGIENVLGQHWCNSKVLQRIHTKASELGTVSVAAREKIAMAGPTGAGEPFAVQLLWFAPSDMQRRQIIDLELSR